MDHGYFHDRISAWLDGELPPYEAQVVGEHLETCEECQALLARLKQVDRLMDERAQLDGGDEQWEAMAQKIERRLGFGGTELVTDIRPKKRSGLVWKITAAAASVAILTFVGLHQEDIFKQKETESTADVMQRVDTVSPQEWLRSDSAEVAQEQADVAGHEPAEPTMEERTTRQQTVPSQAAAQPQTDAGAVSDEAKKTTQIEMKAEDTPLPDTTNEHVIAPLRVATQPPSASAEKEAQSIDSARRPSGPIVVESGPQRDLEKTIKVAGRQDQLQQKADSVVSSRDNVAKLAESLPDTLKAPAPIVFQKSKEADHFVVVDDSTTHTMDELLQDAKDVVTNTSGEVFTSGGAPALAAPGKDRDQKPNLSLGFQMVYPKASDETALDLAGWIKRRDSLETLWADLQSQHGKLAITKGRKENELSDVSLIERQLLEAYYNVAVLARESDQSAYDSALLGLRTYLERPDVQYRSAAQEYLDRLAPDSLDGR